MKNVTVKTSLLGVLVLFAVMLVVGAGLGIFSLQQSNRSIAEVHQIASQVITINDAYKDTTRTRSALTRGYAALKESDNKAERDSALGSAKKSYQRTLDFLDKFEKMPDYPGQDAQLKKDLVDAGRKLSAVLDRASAALVKDDTAAYSAINASELTSTGAAPFSGSGAEE